MTCAACVRRVENALKEVEGVKDASVNLATARATVIHAAEMGRTCGTWRKPLPNTVINFWEKIDHLADPAEAARVRDLKELKLKVTCGAIFSIIIFFGSMQHWFGFLQGIPRQTMLYAMFVLTIPAVFWVGSRFFIGAIKAARQKTSDMNTLVAVGALSAYLYSAAATFFPHFFMTAGVMPHVYYDGAAMIVTLILVGRLLEAKAKGQDLDGNQTASGAETENSTFIGDEQAILTLPSKKSRWMIFCWLNPAKVFRSTALS